MDPVTSTLGLDKADMRGKMIAIEEQHGSDGTFLISSIISHAIKGHQSVCLVLYHNTFSHYHNIGMRFGYNMMALKEKGQITVVEPMNDIMTNIESMCENTLTLSDSILTTSSHESKMFIVYKLFSAIRDKYYQARKYSDSVIIIIDDLSHLFDLGLSLSLVQQFLRYLISILELDPKTQLCILTHVYQEYSTSCAANILSNSLKHMAHLVVDIEPLQTGHSSDASGRLTINWRLDSIRRQFHWPEKAMYLYKLMDRYVKIYAPGMIGALL